MKKNLAVACTMAKPGGRIVRALVGLVLVGIGLAMHGATARDVLVIVGLVPILAGVLKICALSAPLGAPLSGRKALRLAHQDAK